MSLWWWINVFGLCFVICLCGCSESTLNIIYNTWCSRWRKYGFIIYKAMVSQCWQLAKFQKCINPGIRTSVARKWSTVPFLVLQRHSSAGNQGSFWGVSTVKLQEKTYSLCKTWNLKTLAMTAILLIVLGYNVEEVQILSSHPPRQVSPVPRLRWMFAHCELQRHWWAYGGHLQHLGFQTQPVNLHPRNVPPRKAQ